MIINTNDFFIVTPYLRGFLTVRLLLLWDYFKLFVATGFIPWPGMALGQFFADGYTGKLFAGYCVPFTKAMASFFPFGVFGCHPFAIAL